jgi:hypothetical protein
MLYSGIMPEVEFEKWTDDQCLHLEPIWQLCRVRRDAHHKAYRFYYKYNTLASLPPILFGAILSTIGFNPDSVPTGLSAGLAMMITSVSTINTFFALAKNQEGHRYSYRTFNAMVREIEINLIRGREAPKRSFMDFFEYINDKFTRVLEESPTLNPRARKYLNSFRGKRPSPFTRLMDGDKSATAYIHIVDDNKSIFKAKDVDKNSSNLLETVTVDDVENAMVLNKAVNQPSKEKVGKIARLTSKKSSSNDFANEIVSNTIKKGMGDCE